MDEKLRTKVLFEVSQIDKLHYDSKPLLDLCKSKTLDFIELSATALLLHSFYNGIENIIRMISKFYDTKLPNDIKWHMELLEAAFVSNENRKVIFSIGLQEILEEYLRFRHFVRHAYGFQLDWERMENLVTEINNVRAKVKHDINIFMENE